jgi:hypothetical protein
MKKLIYLLVGTMFTSGTALADTCPIAPTSVNAVVNANVSFDHTKKIYTYRYTLSNLRSSPIKLTSVMLRADDDPVASAAPPKWFVDPNKIGSIRLVEFNGIKKFGILPGQKLSGFEIKSYRKPGLVPFFLGGEMSVPSVSPVPGNDEPEPDCPGFIFSGDMYSFNPVGMTTGPELDGVVSSELKYINKKYRHHSEENRPTFDPMSKGEIKLLLKGSKEIDVTSIDLASLAIGFGKAKPLTTKIVRAKGEDKDCDEDKKEKNEKHDSKLPDLVMTFKLEDIGIRCNLDHTLILNGNIGAAGPNQKKLMAFAPISPVFCKKEHMVKMKEFAKAHGIEVEEQVRGD